MCPDFAWTLTVMQMKFTYLLTLNLSRFFHAYQQIFRDVVDGFLWSFGRHFVLAHGTVIRFLRCFPELVGSVSLFRWHHWRRFCLLRLMLLFRSPVAHITYTVLVETLKPCSINNQSTVVCLSVMFMHSAQTAEDIDMISFAYDSPMSLPDCVQIWLTLATYSSPYFAPKWPTRCWFGRLRHLMANCGPVVKHSAMVTIENL